MILKKIDCKLCLWSEKWPIEKLTYCLNPRLAIERTGI